ncbi:MULTISPECIES: ABC transporter permease [unclassified Luteococcus]|uniref:ABC transporter permease n=1 Tax=unclassified Luteococcus TaxID=2639923 RepID=UPI00313D38A2
MSTVIANEIAKMRHLRIGLVAGLYVLAVSGIACFQSFGSSITKHLADPDGAPWKILLSGMSMALAMISPVLLAVLASRQVEMEHTGNGWLLSATSGVTPGRLCRAKFLVLGAITVVAIALQSLLVAGFGLLLGATSPFPASHWLGYTASIMVISLAVLAFQILLSAHVENQLVALGVGIVGIFLAIFGVILPTWVAHLTPWSYYSMTTPADYVGTDLRYFELPYPSIAALAVVGTAVFAFITARFDTQEA